MAHIEPGERFDVPYGTKGKSLSALSLGLRKQREVMKLVAGADSVQTDRKFVLAEEALRICFPNITDEQVDDLNYNMTCEAIGHALAATRPDEDEEKK